MIRIRHDLAWRAAGELAAVIAPNFREEEILEARREFYQTLLKLLSDYDAQRAREAARLQGVTP